MTQLVQHRIDNLFKWHKLVHISRIAKTEKDFSTSVNVQAYEALDNTNFDK
jgi:hypothetical protein